MGPFPEQFHLMWNVGRVGRQLRRKCWCFYFQQQVPKWVRERPGFKFLDAQGDLQSHSQLSCSGGLFSAAPEQNCTEGLVCLGRDGRDGLLAWWLGLQGEGRLVSRQSSGWIKSSLLEAVVGEEGSCFLFCSCPAGALCSQAHSLWFWMPGSMSVAGCLRYKGLLFAVPLAQGWLTSCLSNSFETFLFSNFWLQSEAIYEACDRNCTVLPGATLHHFLFAWAGWQGSSGIFLPVEMLHSSQGALFISRAGCRQAVDLSQGGKHERRWGPGCRCGSRSLGALWFVWGLTVALALRLLFSQILKSVTGK